VQLTELYNACNKIVVGGIVFIKKKNDISRYEFLVLITMLLVLIGMVKPFWYSYYAEKIQELRQSEIQLVDATDNDLRGN
jgi:hypothetical protein